MLLLLTVDWRENGQLYKLHTLEVELEVLN